MMYDLSEFTNHSISRSGEVTRKSDGKVLKPWIGKNGYYSISLRRPRDKKDCSVYLHRLIAYHYIPNDDKSKMYVNHIDGDKTNNAIENLEWCTHKENMNHAIDTGLWGLNSAKFSEEFYEKCLVGIINGTTNMLTILEELDGSYGHNALAKHIRALARRTDRYEAYRKATISKRSSVRKANYEQTYVLQQINMKTLEVIKEFSSIREAVEYNGWDYKKANGSIHNACNSLTKDGKKRKARGFYWNQINLNDYSERKYT